MKFIRSLNNISSMVKGFRQDRKTIGFVPTMGAFHEGHTSLIKRARKENDIVIASVFVNPSQFGLNEDYKKYPRDIKKDKEKAKKAGCDILFFPDTLSIYPEGYKTYVEVKGLSDVMCGKSRPGHFRGVATVCIKLFNIVMPDIAYFGQKDFQQAVIIKNMVNELNMNLAVKTVPIVREASGLAMSSRNIYLTPKQKENAGLLYRSLKKAEQMIRAGVRSSSKVKSSMKKILGVPGIRIDYIAIVSPGNLSEKSVIDEDALIALAARVGKTRLIDNIVVRLKD